MKTSWGPHGCCVSHTEETLPHLKVTTLVRHLLVNVRHCRHTGRKLYVSKYPHATAA